MNQPNIVSVERWNVIALQSSHFTGTNNTIFGIQLLLSNEYFNWIMNATQRTARFARYSFRTKEKPFARQSCGLRKMFPLAVTGIECGVWCIRYANILCTQPNGYAHSVKHVSVFVNGMETFLVEIPLEICILQHAQCTPLIWCRLNGFFSTRFKYPFHLQ